MVPAVISAIIFIGSLGLIFTERFNRVIVALLGAVLMVGVGILFNFYSEEQAIAAIDFNTLGLLLGMMILISILEPTGLFEFLAIYASKLSHGKPLLLFIFLGTVTTLLSMFLDNVTTVILIAPVTAMVCEILGVNPQPFLMAEALLSDTGGVATLVGDPPNILIASEANLSFVDFLTHSFPIVLIAWFVALSLLGYLFREDLKKQPTQVEALEELNPYELIKDAKTAKKTLFIIGMAFLLFLFEEHLRFSLAFIALSAAAAALVIVQPPVRDVFQRIQWDIILFFTGLFVMIGGLQASMIFHYLAILMKMMSFLPPNFFGVIILWLVAILSALIDNVPITMAMIPVIKEIGLLGYPISALWWALAFGAGFGGNGTIIGSTANIVVVSISEKTRAPITPSLWHRRGLPIMIATCFIASLLFLIFYQQISQ